MVASICFHQNVPHVYELSLNQSSFSTGFAFQKSAFKTAMKVEDDSGEDEPPIHTGEILELEAMAHPLFEQYRICWTAQLEASQKTVPLFSLTRGPSNIKLGGEYAV